MLPDQVLFFTQDDSHFYILTNHHVTYSENAERTTYAVYDYQGNKYLATLVVSDASYDLSILKISKGTLVP